LVKTGQKYRAIYKNIAVCFIVDGDIITVVQHPILYVTESDIFLNINKECIVKFPMQLVD